MKLKNCKNPTHIAQSVWQILEANPINKITYLIFLGIECLILAYYHLNIMSKVHYRNLHNIPHEDVLEQQNMTAFQENQSGIKFTFIGQIDNGFRAYSQPEYNNVWFSLTIALFSFMTFIFLSIFIFASQSKKDVSQSINSSSSVIKGIISLLLILFQTVIQMPTFDIILRSLISLTVQNEVFQVVILKYGFIFITLILFIMLQLFIAKIFTLSIPTQQIYWSCSFTNMIYFDVVLKMVVVGFVVIDQNSQYIIIEEIALFLGAGFKAIYRLLFIKYFHQEVDLLIKTREFFLFLIHFISLFCMIQKDQQNFDLVYLIFFFPFITIAIYLFEEFRVQQIILKLKSKTLKLEIEYELALNILMRLIQQTNSESVQTQKIFGQLMDIVITHIEECDDPLCICDEMENFYELMRFKYIHNNEIVPLSLTERKQYKKILDEQGLIGTVSNMTDLVLKTHNSESTHLKTLNEFEKLSKLHQQDQNNSQQTQNNQLLQVTNTRKLKKPKTYKINIDSTRAKFLSELVYLFIFDIMNKFPDSYKLQLLANYFSLQFKKKSMLCIYQMRNYPLQKLSFIDKIVYSINELYLLREVAKLQRIEIQNDNYQDGNLNGEYFIKINQLYKDFNISIETLSTSVSGFWREFQKENIFIENLQSLGSAIAQNIRKTFKIFSKLDEIKLFKDYQMYFQFAIVQLHILNDQLAYEQYIGKMKSIIETNKMIQKNYAGLNSSTGGSTDYSNFMIVNANGQKFGQIIQMNNSLRVMLGWKVDEFKAQTIESFMPYLIKEKHSEFLKRYNRTGQSFVINNKTILFVKKKSGFVIPVELQIKFHYSIDYQYVFLAIINPVYEMAPFQNNIKYNVDQLLYLICDNDEGRIYDYSESFKTQLNLGKNLSKEVIVKHIDHFIQDFNFQTIKASRQQRYLENEIYEDYLRVDLQQLIDITESDIDQVVTSVGKVYTRLRIFEERYCGGVLDLNIFCFLLIQDSDGTLSQFNNNSDNIILSAKLGIINHDSIFQNEKDMKQDLVQEEREASSCASSSVASSSKISTTSSMIEYRNFHAFNQQQTPRSLKIILQLIFVLYMVMIIISSINLGLNIQRQRQSESDVHVVSKTNERLSLVTSITLIMRILLNIANGYISNQTFFDNRFETYQNLLRNKVQELKIVQSNLQQSSFDKSEILNSILEGRTLNLSYINELNQFYHQNENVNIGINLYLARLTEIGSFQINDLKGNLDIQNMKSQRDNRTYKPSKNEQLIYFVQENGLRSLTQISEKLVDLYARDSEDHAEKNINNTKVLVIVSVLTILVIGFIIAPIFTQAEIRKFNAFKFFLQIPRQLYPLMIQNCEYCLNMNDEAKYDEIQKDYEKFLGIKIRNQQINQLRQANDQRLNIIIQKESTVDNNSKRDTNSDNFNSSTMQYLDSSIFYYSVQSGVTQDTKGIKNDKQQQQINSASRIQKDRQINNNSPIQSLKANNDTINKQISAENQNLTLEQLKEIEEKEKQKVIQQDLIINEDKAKQINLRAKQKRIYLSVLVIIVILCLSTYFIIAYFLAINTFKTSADVIKSVELLFQRSSCFDTTLNFFRESVFKRQLLNLVDSYDGDQIIGLDYYLQRCIQKEKEYKQLVVNLPNYLQSSKNLLQDQDSSQVCSTAYDQNSYNFAKCITLSNGILQKGLSNSLYYMYQIILKNEIVLQNLLSNKSSDLEAYINLNRDPALIQVVDLKGFILDPIFNRQKESALSSVVKYIQKLLQDFIIAYVIFILILSISSLILVFFGFKKLRKAMWDTNIILKIIPFEAISQEERVKIKDFFNN